jgi:hypothetical protein
MIDSSASYWNNFKIKEIFNMSFLNRPIVVNLFFLDDRLISYGIEIEHVEADEIARCDSEYVAFLKTKYGNPHILSLNPPHSFCVWDTNSTSIYYTSSEIIAHVDNLSPSPIGYANVQRISARMMFYYKPFQDTLHTLSMKYEPPTINNKWRQPNQALKLTE